MILESIFSCTNLILTCGSSIYILVKHSYARHSKFFTHLTYACIGIAMIGSRSLIVLAYKLFFKEYRKGIESGLKVDWFRGLSLHENPYFLAFDPTMIEFEEEKSKGRLNILDEILRTLSMAGLIYSLYSCHGYYVLGFCVVTTLSIVDAIKLHRTRIQFEEINILSFIDYISRGSRFESSAQSEQLYDTKLNIFSWAIINGWFAYAVGNNYAVVANYPLLLANWALSPEGFYQGWTVRRSINDYLMASYVMCMTEALRQTDM